MAKTYKNLYPCIYDFNNLHLAYLKARKGKRYASKLDHYCKETLRIKLYLRYMDDFIIFYPDKAFLRAVLRDVELFLQDNLHLRLNDKTQIFPIGPRSVDFLGYRIWPDYRLLRKSNLQRTKRKFKKYTRLNAEGKLGLAEIRPSIMSCLGHCKHADTWRIRSKVLGGLKFVGAEEERAGF